MRQRKYILLTLLAAFMLGLSGTGSPGADQDKKKKKSSTKKVAGRVLTQVLVRDNKDKSWKPVTAKGTVKYGELLVGGYGAALVNSHETVQLTMLGDLSGLSPYRIIETAAVLNPPKAPGIDLDFTLDRGRVDLVNLKKDGAAHVRFHVQKETWEMVLQDPGTSVGLELYGRWPRGMPFKMDAGPDYGPHMSLIVVVLKGHVDFLAAGQQFHLSAPPGPTLLEWDSVTGWDRTPTFQDKLPAWADSATPENEAAKIKKQTLTKFRLKVRKEGLDATLKEFLNSTDPDERRIAIYVLGATDNLSKIGEVLNKAKYPDVWENAVLVLRHWLGRGPGQDQILYQQLLKKKISPAHAHTILDLLHRFSDAQLAQPETYELLIEYLGHDLLGIRGLAYWHLIRLVPAGAKIAYHPLDPPELRAKAQKEWRKLIPPGQMPPKLAAPK